MLVCGVEITTNEAILCLLGHDKGAFNIPECRQRTFKLPKIADTQAIRDFNFAFKKLMEDYKVDEVVIIERPLKGKNAGSTLGFKLETAMQLIDIPVSFINHSLIKDQMKRNPMQAEFDSLGLKKFQQQALHAGYAYQNELLYPSSDIVESE